MRSSPTALEESGLLRGVLRRPWVWDALTGAVTLLCTAYIIHVYFPGRGNLDVASQLRQALGLEQYSDWHPPLVAFVWEILIDLTGSVGSLFVVQAVLFFFSGWLLAVWIHRHTGRRSLSLLGLLVPVLPWSISQISTMWKDTQMAVALLLAVLLLFFIRRGRRLDLLLLLPSGMLLLFAIGARKNAVFAVVPIAFYIAWVLLGSLRRRTAARAGADGAGGPRRSPRRVVRKAIALAGTGFAVLAVLGVGTIGVDRGLAAARDVKPTGQISQIMLDDVMFSVPDAELWAADAPHELKERISSSRSVCIEKDKLWDAYWSCYGRGVGGEGFAPIEHQDEVRSLWVELVAPHPGRYLEYRMAVFSHYFFTSRFEYWHADWDPAADELGLNEYSRNGEYLIRPYVEDFARGIFPMVFKPWFWFATGAVVLVAVRRVAAFRPQIAVLAASGLTYILGYIPIAPANHFRYTYWPALAITCAVLLLICGLVLGRSRSRDGDARAQQEPESEASRFEGGDQRAPASPSRAVRPQTSKRNST